MKKILITGATGFIGKHLTNFFLSENHKVIAHGSSKESIMNLADFLRQKGNYNQKLEFWEQNFLRKEWSFPEITDFDGLIHCAAITKVRKGILENYEKYFSINIEATKKIARKAINQKINHIIYFSSGQVYGRPDSFPITEQTVKTPINLYGYTKLIGELVIKSFGLFDLNYTILRPFSVYGEGHNNIISIITNKIKNNEILTIYGDGTQTRAFSHVNDVCLAVDLILNNETCFGEEYNLCGSKEYSINELVKIISKTFEKKPRIIHKESGVNELERNIADLSKIKKIGFKNYGSLKDFINSIRPTEAK